MAEHEKLIRSKMQQAGLSEPTIRAFLRAVGQIANGATGMIPESAIQPVDELPHLDTMEDSAHTPPMHELVVVKLNGGLGTGMGLDRAKSLLPVRDGETFLDLIAQQVLAARNGDQNPAFYLMNSFSTQQDTLEHLRRYAGLPDADGTVDFLQSQVPKIDPNSFAPVSWPANPALEWCPPGHGDLYPSLAGSGLLDALLERGIKYMFVSNSDNLGATIDPALLNHFAESGQAFMMEVAKRTAADRKGGHLARRADDGRLLLREAAQTAEQDLEHFQDIGRHRFFNTNNLWVHLGALREALGDSDGVIPLPLICNSKTVDPKDSNSPPVLQLESAMGAAIECFTNSGAIVVPRSRFAPVKTTADLLALRSDAYVITDDHCVQLDPKRHGQPPLIELDSAHYKVMDKFEAAFSQAVPSLIDCRSLKVRGPLKFSPGISCLGDVSFINESDDVRTIHAGEYSDTEFRA